MASIHHRNPPLEAASFVYQMYRFADVCLRSRLPAMPAARFLVLVLIALGLSRSSTGQDADRMRFVRWVLDDAGAYSASVASQAPFATVLGAFMLVQSAPFDADLLNGVQENHRGPLRSFLHATNELGGPRVTPVVAGVFTTSLLTRNERFQDAAFTSLQSLLFAGAVTKTLKTAFGRYRPEAGNGAFDFVPFSGNTSFPSGHTTAAFAIITPWVLYYPNTATYGLFALSTGTAVARIALDKHWPSDVLAGAAIGFLTARYLTRRHLISTARGADLTIEPLLSTSGSGLTFRLELEARR